MRCCIPVFSTLLLLQSCLSPCEVPEDQKADIVRENAEGYLAWREAERVRSGEFTEMCGHTTSVIGEGQIYPGVDAAIEGHKRADRPSCTEWTLFVIPVRDPPGDSVYQTVLQDGVISGAAVKPVVSTLNYPQLTTDCQIVEGPPRFLFVR